MRFINILPVLLFTLVIQTFTPSYANEDINLAEEEPLIIIRFNKDFIDYEKSLRKVVSSALKVKSSTFFDIVAVVPATKDRKLEQKYSKNTKENAENIANDIRKHGIRDDRIRVTYKDSENVESPEVKVFVR